MYINFCLSGGKVNERQEDDYIRVKEKCFYGNNMPRNEARISQGRGASYACTSV